MTLYLQDRLLAAVRPQHRASRRASRATPTPDAGAGHRRLGAPLVLRRPGHRRARSPRRWRGRARRSPGPVHRPVRRAASVTRSGLEPPPHDVDLRVGHPHGRLRGARQSSTRSAATDLDEAIAEGARRGRRRRRMRDAGRRRPMPATWRDPALREASSARSTTRSTCCGTLAAYRDDGPAARRSGTTPARRDGVRQWRQAARRAYRSARARRTSTRYEGDVDLPGVQPHRRRARASSAPTATWRWRGSPACCSSSPLAWLVIGMLAARHAARAAAGRGGRAGVVARRRRARGAPRESTLGMLPLDRRLLVVVPGALLVATPARADIVPRARRTRW